MANYATLKAAIQAVIKQNGNNEITGSILQSSLLSMIDSLGVGYQFIGIATPTTNPGTPDQKIFYIATTPGDYTNFGEISVDRGEIAILKFDSSWAKIGTNIVSNYETAKGYKDVFVVLNNVSITVDGTQRIFDLLPGSDYVTLIIRYDGKSKYMYVPGLAKTANTVYWFSKDYVWDYSNYLGFRRFTQTAVDLTTKNGLQYVYVTYRKSEQPDFDPQKARVIWSKDFQNYITSGGQRTELEPTIRHGEYYYNGTKYTNVAAMDTYSYTVDPTKKYVVRGFGVPSSGYANIQFIHFFIDGTWITYDFPLAAGPYIQTENYYVLEIPANCDTMIVETYNQYTVECFELSANDPIFSQDLKDRIEKLETGVGENKLNKIIKTGPYIYARTPLDDTRDIVVRYMLWQNNNYTWDRTFVGQKTESLEDIISNDAVHVMGDSTGALAITNDAPWHLWAQHGYCIPYISATHTLDSTDIGAIWKDQLDRQYKIGNINGNIIYLLPVISQTEYPGVYTRSWKSPTAANNPSITTLIHVSGGTHTSTITPDVSSNTQLRPMMTLKKRTLLADGVEITDDGIYNCNEFVISETLNCVNPWTVQTWWPVTPVDFGAEYTQNFTICGLGHRFDVILNMKKPYLFDWYGANQIQHLIPTTAMPGYDVYGLMPRVRNYDTPYLANNLSRSSEIAYNNLTSLYDTDKQPDRFISFFKNGSDTPLGCAGGLSIIRGISKDENRPSLAVENDILLDLSPHNNNKAYFRLIHRSKFQNGIMPASFICNISSYLCYFNPNKNAGQVYWYKDGNSWMVYAHYQSAQDKIAISVPSLMDGLNIEIVDKTDGMTLHTDIVDGGNIYVSADNATNNYIVLRIS